MWLTPRIGAHVAKYEKSFKGELEPFLAAVEASILDQSATAEIVDYTDVMVGRTRVSVRVWERYSVFGSSRVSLSLTVAGCDGWVYASAIGSGGSQALVLKVNTLSEENFLATAVAAIDAAAGQSEA
jgi:uncharacterized protein DUF6054